MINQERRKMEELNQVEEVKEENLESPSNNQSKLLTKENNSKIKENNSSQLKNDSALSKNKSGKIEDKNNKSLGSPKKNERSVSPPKDDNFSYCFTFFDLKMVVSKFK